MCDILKYPSVPQQIVACSFYKFYTREITQKINILRMLK